MSSTLEFEGKNIDKAIDSACRKLNIAKRQLKYKVLTQGSSGIFGLVGAKNARIQVVVSNTKNRRTPNSDSDKTQPSAGTGGLKRSWSKPDRIESLAAAIDCEVQSATQDELSDPVELARTTLQKILDFITVDSTISIERQADTIYLNVAGGNPAVLIGKRGQTLEAIQYIVEKVVNKQNKKRVRLRIDVAGYLKNRRENLQNLASRLAQKAKISGKPVSVGMLNAYDRRIVHVALKSDQDVKTRSIGEGFTRKLMIYPKKNGRQNSKPIDLQ
jgi:spoIIIJ-associated protein